MVDQPQDRTRKPGDAVSPDGELSQAGTGPDTAAPAPLTGSSVAPAASNEALRATAALSAPAAVVLVALVVLDQVPWIWAAAGFGLIVLTVFLIVRQHFVGLMTLRRHLDDRAVADDLEAALRTRTELLAQLGEIGAAADLALALDRVDRAVLALTTRLRGEADRRGLIIDSIPDPLIMVDPRIRITSANQAARSRFGQHIVDRDLSTVIRHPDVLARVKAALADGTGGEAELAIAAPVERVFKVRVEPMHDDGARPSLAVMLFVDLSAIRRAEQMRVDFVANVSHELRTPLATLLGFIETLQGPARGDVDAQDKFLDIMRGQANRMSRLVQDLLSLSRIEINEHTPPTEPVELLPVLDNVKAMLDLEARRKDMRIRLEIARDLPDVTGDEDELAQVVQNLVDNAIKYGKAGSEVTVVAKRAGKLPPSFPDGRAKAVMVSVRDRGDGIPQEHIPRLTERFYRVDTARSRELGGTGLGLAIVKHIVSRHQGALNIESAAGEGSTFQVYLPVAGKAETTSKVSAA